MLKEKKYVTLYQYYLSENGEISITVYENTEELPKTYRYPWYSGRGEVLGYNVLKKEELEDTSSWTRYFWTDKPLEAVKWMLEKKQSAILERNYRRAEESFNKVKEALEAFNEKGLIFEGGNN